MDPKESPTTPLITGPVCRIDKELLRDEYYQEQSWRIFRIMAEFVAGFELLKKYHWAVSIFGSARSDAEHSIYADAEKLAARLAKEGFPIITGGASGIMEAANKGAYEAGGKSVGLNIDLHQEQGFNRYLTDMERFHYFFTRKVMLSYASEVYVFFPGGFGTLDEFFEIITLIQTKKIDRIPVVLVGKEYWQGMIQWMNDTVIGRYKAIYPEEMELFYVAESVDDAFNYIMKATEHLRKSGASGGRKIEIAP